ncbi:hypothetical protein AALP_AAs55131U000100, partial [Arabis alpina]
MAKTKGTGGRGGRGGGGGGSQKTSKGPAAVGGSRVDTKDEGKRPATRGGYLKLSKPAGNPTA